MGAQSFNDIFAAARTFGKFKDSFLAELHSEILSHAKQEASGLVPRPVEGITVHDSEVLEPDPIREGGLMRRDTVCNYSYATSFDGVLTCGLAATYLPSTCETNRASNSSDFNFRSRSSCE